MNKWQAVVGTLIFFGLLGSFWNPEKHEWKVTQLTACEAGTSGQPQVAENGNIIIFVSTCDFTDQNSDHNTEIFKWENGEFSQLTDTANCQFLDLAMSPNGRRLAFVTNCPLGGKNPDQGLELGVMDGPGDFSVLTRGGGYASRRPAWSPDSNLIVFESHADLKGGNPDHSSDIFMADLSTPEPKLKRISNSHLPGGCERPALAGGAIIARCNDDLPGTAPMPGAPDLTETVEGRTVGGNPDKNFELFSFDISGKPRQLTYTTYCNNGPPSLQPKGRAIVFMSDCDFSGKMSAELDKLHSFSGTLSTRGHSDLYILTSNLRRAFPDLDFIATSFAWSADGKTLALTSPFGADSVNPEHNQEIFITRLDPEGLVTGGHGPALTDPSPVTDFLFGASGSVAVNRDGTMLVFESNTNLDHKNPDGGPEIFTAAHEDATMNSDDDSANSLSAGDTAK